MKYLVALVMCFSGVLIISGFFYQPLMAVLLAFVWCAVALSISRTEWYMRNFGKD